MTNKTLYLPIRSTTLPHYFGKGMILPSKFLSNKPSDFQDIYNDTLFISEHRWYAGSDCSIEIVLTEMESPFLSIENGYFLFSGALPISRIRNVFFVDENQMKTTLYNINIGAAFLPDHLVTVDKIKASPLNRPSSNGRPESSVNLAEKIKRYDILLGGVSFMRVVQNRNTGISQDYSAVVGFFNPYILEMAKIPRMQKVDSYDERLTSIFTNKKSAENIEIIKPYIFDEINFELVERFSRQYGIKANKKYGLVNFEEIPYESPLFILAALATYGQSKSLSLDDFISQLNSNKFPQNKVQELALIFGLNVRYSRLRNKYKASDNAVKFKLDNIFDYYVIESIFQFVFYSIRNSRKFPFIEDLSVKLTSDSSILDKEPLPPASTTIKEKSKVDILASIYNPFVDEIQHATSHYQSAILNISKKTIEKSHEHLIAATYEESKQLLKEISELRVIIDNKNELIARLEQEVKLVKNDKIHDDELSNLDFKELKKIAKQRKISATRINSIKQTQSGFKELISLINATKTLL